MKKSILIFLLFVSLDSFATMQTPDLLIIGTDTIELKQLYEYPLESLNLKYRPLGYKGNLDAPTTACWRGYRAIWKVIDEQIYLEKILRCYGDDLPNRSEDIFKLFKKNGIQFQQRNDLILADWINMDLYKDFIFKGYKIDNRILLTDQGIRNKKPPAKNLMMRIEKGRIVLNRLSR